MPQVLQQSEVKQLIPLDDRKDNLNFRIEFHKNCEQREEAREAAVGLFLKDPIAFFALCLWTYDPRKRPADIPFLPWENQVNYILKIDSRIEKGEDELTEKSRDVGATWMILGVFFKRWLLLDENFLIGSRKEELVDKIGDIDSLFERLRYMLKTVPPWILDYCGFDKRDSGYMKIFKENGASLVGESMNESFSRQGRYNAILLDEFAHVPIKDEAIWMSCGDSAPCRLPTSTPKGNRNKFARLRSSGKIGVTALHWSQHPEKDQAWYDREKARRTAEEIAQELDINYNISAGKPFIVGFNRAYHVMKLSTVIGKELILGWDYGYLHPCCVVTQLDAKGRWLILDCVFGEDEEVGEFGTRVGEFLNINYPNMPQRCWGDPAGEQKSDKSKRTSVEILKSIGFTISSVASNTPDTNYDARKRIMEGKLKLLIGGLPALLINDIPRNQIIIEAFEGGYRYPEANKYGAIVEKPVRDGYYEHPMNSLEYIAVNIFKAVDRSRKTDSRKTARYHEIAGQKNAGFGF